VNLDFPFCDSLRPEGALVGLFGVAPMTDNRAHFTSRILEGERSLFGSVEPRKGIGFQSEPRCSEMVLVPDLAGRRRLLMS
jgi:hypothetical protein